MNYATLKKNLHRAIKRKGYAYKTYRSYLGVADRYWLWSRGKEFPTSQARAARFLSEIAENGRSYGTQKQALCALLFLYKEVIGEDLGFLEGFRLAKKPQTLPVWVTRREADLLFGHMKGVPLEMAQLMFGAGLRLSECLKLRVRDIDFENCLINIKGAKGKKDRTTYLPKMLVDTLRVRIKESRYTWEQDQKENLPPVETPEGVRIKYPNCGKDWAWFWIWPGRKPSVDPESGIRRRHHIHSDTLGKGLKIAVTRSQIGKRVTAHSFRHGFATAMLMNGATIHEVQELLGHSSIKTTEIYLHCLPQLTNRTQSPLDVQPDIIPFTPPATMPQQKIS